MRFDDEAWNRWREWIATIKDDLSGTVNDQFVSQEFRKLLQENGEWIDEHEGAFFCDFVLRSYVSRAVFGIRRHLKDKDDSISLARLLGQMQTCAPQICFDFYLTQFPRKASGPPWQQRAFGQLSEDGKYLSSSIIGADLSQMKELNHTVEPFADRALAHLDKKGSTAS